jgi:hypothetical protein
MADPGHYIPTTARDEHVIRSIAEMISPILSIPEAERTTAYRAAERLSRTSPDSGLLPSYNIGSLAGIWLRIANLTWPEWPLQETSAGVSSSPVGSSGPTASERARWPGPGEH